MGNTIGSGFDVSTFVELAMSKERASFERMQKTEHNQEISLSILGQLKNAVDALKTSLDKIGEAFRVITYAASVSNTAVLSAQITGNDNVFPSTHNVVVNQLATATTVGSTNTFASRTAALNLNGNLAFTVGAKTFSVNATATSSLNNIRDAINSAPDNNGVTASIVASTDGSGNPQYSLLVSSSATGTANAVAVSGSLTSNFNFTNISAAQDANFTFDGMSVVRSSNTVSDVLDGLTFTMSAVSTTAVQINITPNNTEQNTAVLTAIKNAVETYNQVLNFIDQNIADSSPPKDKRKETEKDKANRLPSEITLQTVKTNLQNLFSSALSNIGNFSSLGDIGIKTAQGKEMTTKNGNKYTAYGQLRVDEKVLKGAIADQSGDLQTLFMDKANGFLQLARADIYGVSDEGGVIATRSKTLNESNSKLNRAMLKESNRLEKVEKELKLKYANLGAMMGKFDSLSSFLDQQFASFDMGRKK